MKNICTTATKYYYTAKVVHSSIPIIRFCVKKLRGRGKKMLTKYLRLQNEEITASHKGKMWSVDAWVLL